MDIAQRIINFFLLASLASSCAAPSPWVLQTIEAGNQIFDTSRLRYSSAQPQPPFLFELLKIGSQIDGFISLTRFRFTSKEQVPITLTIGDEKIEKLVSVHEGAMRIRLESEMTLRLIQALQEGLKVGILIDGFEETLDPVQFASSFTQFKGKM